MIKKITALLLIASLGLVGCGVKGPLYFPEQQEQTTLSE